MDISEDKLINNAFMFIYARQNKPTAEKIVNIENILNEGADINSTDANYKNNTILHISTQNDEIDIVQFLLNRNALLLYNTDNKTPVHIAKENKTVASKEILKLLTNYGRCVPRTEDLKVHETKPNENYSTLQNNNPDIKKEILYPKRSGTSGVSGQFYETKLLCLVYHRAFYDKEIQEYYLAANIRDIGDFDDVCFRFTLQENGHTQNVLCFIQAKHREDTDKAKLTVASVRSTSGQFCLTKYYDSFLRIKQKFLTNMKSQDPMFDGKFHDMDCYFILYTPLKESFHRKVTENIHVNKKLHAFIYTGEKEEVFQFNYEIEDIHFLTIFMQQERIKILGKVFLTFILSNKTKDIMTNDLIQIYHPALAQNVIKLFKIKDPNYLEGKFRDEFFETDDDLLKTLKETLFKEIVFTKEKKSAASKDEIKNRIENLINNPSPETISPLIGQAIYYDEKTNKLCFEIDKKFKQDEVREINHNLHKVQVTLAMINDAISMTGKNKLKALTFTLPYTFGNLDFPSNLKDGQIPEDRLKFIAKKFCELIQDQKKCLEEEKIKSNKNDIQYPIEIVISNHNVGPKKILELSHLNTKGLGGTVGNLLQFNTENQTFTFNSDKQSLGPNATYMYDEINKTIEDDLTQYNLKVKMNNFPRSSFNPNQNDKEEAEEFLNKLWFYTNQAKEETVESILKNEIDYYYNANKHQNQFLFRVHSDAIFLRYHDEMQKWWKTQSQARYLTKSDNIFDEAKKDIIDSPVLTVLNVMYIRTLKQFKIEFKADVIHSINLDKAIGHNKILNILTDAVVLSAAKIMQKNSFQTKYTFINLDYIHLLPENDYSKMMEELKETNSVTLIIICETSIGDQLRNTLSKIITMYTGKMIIVSDELIQQNTYQNHKFAVFKDENISLNDLQHESQTKILKEFIVNYQGKDITLNTIIDDASKYLVDGKLLHSILYKNKIKIGQPLDSDKYNQIKDRYVNRSLFLDDEEHQVKTLNDIDDNVVLITSSPCTGKSTLLTHLSLETKKKTPQPWIVRINMSSALCDDLAKWPDKNVKVTHIMRFLCKAALKKTDQINTLDFTEVTAERIAVNSENYQDLPFELEWFIHCYNNGQIIFLFDGFDKIFPHHTKQGIALLMALQRSNKRMWITSSPYVAILEQELGTPYTLDKLSTSSHESTLTKFLKTNRKIEKLNHQQYYNLSTFINFLLQRFCPDSDGEFDDGRAFLPLLSAILHFGYVAAADYFKNEPNNLSPKFLREVIKKKWMLNSYTILDRFLRKPDRKKTLELTGTPLHIYIAENYFEIQTGDTFDLLPDKGEMYRRFNKFITAIASYERFLNIKHIRQQQGNKIMATLEEREHFFDTYKTLALFAISKDNDLTKLLSESEIREVKDIMERVESGKTIPVPLDCVLDNIPRCYNLLFAEYFGLEFPLIFEGMLSRNDGREWFESESWWNFIVNLIIMISPSVVRNAFHYKLKNDPDFVANNVDCDNIKFELVLKQDQIPSTSRQFSNTTSSFDTALNESLVNIIRIFMQTICSYIDTDNVYEFMNVLKRGAFWLEAVNSPWKELITNILHCIEYKHGEKVNENVNAIMSTELGNNIQQKVKSDVLNSLVDSSSDDKNTNNVNMADTIPINYEFLNQASLDVTTELKEEQEIKGAAYESIKTNSPTGSSNNTTEDDTISTKNVIPANEVSLAVANLHMNKEFQKSLQQKHNNDICNPLNNFLDNWETCNSKHEETNNFIENAKFDQIDDMSRDLVNIVTNSELGKDLELLIKTDLCKPIKAFTETIASCSAPNQDANGESTDSTTSDKIGDIMMQNVVSLVINSEFGKDWQQKIKTDVCDPIKKFTDDIEACSIGIDIENRMKNENLCPIKDISLKFANLVVNTELGKDLQQTIQSDICEPIKDLTNTFTGSSSTNNYGNGDGTQPVECVNTDKIENVSRKIVNLAVNSELGKNLQQKVKNDIVEPIKKITEEIVASSSNNQNLATLVETLPYHLPAIINSLFSKSKQ